MIRRLASMLGKGTPLGRLHAAELDFKTACALLELNERMVAGERDLERLPLLHEELRQKWAASELSAALPFANDSMTVQLAEMFQHVHDIDSGDITVPARPPTLSIAERKASSAFTTSIGPSTHTNPLPTLRMQMKALHEAEERSASIETRYALQARLGFSLWLGPSQACYEGHAAGVWLRGRAAPGQVVALYPGAIYNGEHLTKGVDAGHLGNPAVQRQFIPRFDESVLDVWASGSASLNPFALAQHVRHPPSGIAPNVMRLQYDWVHVGEGPKGRPDVLPFPPHLRPYIPNSWGSDVSTSQALFSSLEQDIWCKGVVLIALRPLWQEELFADHTLNPYAKQAGLIPPWAEGAWAARRDMRRLGSRVSQQTAEGGRAAQLGPATGLPVLEQGQEQQKKQLQ